MPSYRYLRDITPEEQDQKPEKQYSKKEKLANWFHYSWKWLAAALALLLLAGFFIKDIVTQVKPDISIGIISPSSLPEDLTAKLQESLAAYAADVNGDGKVVVQIEVYTVTAGTAESEPAQSQTESQALTAQDPYTQMAGVTRLSGAFSAGEPILFLVSPEEAEFYQQQYGIFGDEKSEGSVEGLTTAWQDCPALAGLDLTFTQYDGTTANGQLLLEGYRLGLRSLTTDQLAKNNGWQQNLDNARSFYSKLFA